MSTTNSITITFLSKISFASLNGSDKDVDNINSIKKVTLADGKQLPYMSGQALRRALRDRLEEMGEDMSPILATKENKKAPSITNSDPATYIDDDLFGYMDASSKPTTQRTSAVRVDALIALSPYQGDLDFGTNYQGKDIGQEPNIFESEVHSGVYRGTIMIELDRVGKGRTVGGQPFDQTDYVDNATKAARVNKLIDAIHTLWSSGRQSRFLSDISPKFVAAAWMKAKNPIFLEAVNYKDGQINTGVLKTVTEDYAAFIEDYVFAAQEAVFPGNDDVTSLQDGFTRIKGWVGNYYGI
jgi:CRISPR-associated protein Cst2